MNIQEYILSGIVESYVLGLAEKEERAEFERMCAAHTEVRAAREAFEILLEQQAVKNAIEPPKDLKTKIFAEIEKENQRSSSPVIPISASSKMNTKNQTETIRSLRWMRYLAVASIILLLGSTTLNFYFFRQYKTYSVRYDNLLATQQQLASANTAIEAKLQSYEADIAIIRDPNMTVVKMPGVEKTPVPGSLATVYWDTRTKNVYLLVNKMQQPASDKQYQLWALVDGKPVDAGVFDTNTDTLLAKMKNIANAQAFAITLEKKGGSPAPTMEQLYVLGYVKT